jgi:hypothetical protein
MKMPIVTASRTLLKTFWPLYVIGVPRTMPCSFANASKLPSLSAIRASLRNRVRHR